MGSTKGLVGYVHKGKRFFRYVRLGGYPRYLGAEVINEIPSDPEEFQRWLDATKEMLENIDTEKVKDWRDDNFPLGVERSDLFRTSRKVGPGNPISYTYVVDLDTLKFIVNDEFRFQLNGLPPTAEWLGYFAVDGSLEFCLAPWMPDKYLADSVNLPPPPLSDQGKEALAYYLSLTTDGETQISKILPSTWLASTAISRRLAISESLALVAAKGFLTGRYAEACSSSAQFKSRTHVQHLAQDIFTAACHCGSDFTFDSNTAQQWADEMYKKSRKELRTQKRHDSFWFRGRLVRLVVSLEGEDRFKSEVGRALLRLQKLAIKECTAILWSIHHVAVIILSGSNVSHSDPIPVAVAIRMIDEPLDEGIKLITHYLPPVAVYEHSPFDSRLPMDVVLRVMELSDNETFAALGQTSKALRFEYLRRPRIDDYHLVSVQGKGFLATDEDGRFVDITLRHIPIRGFRDDFVGERPEEKRLTWPITAWRKPHFYFANRWDYTVTVAVDNFKNVHGYRASAEPRTSRLCEEAASTQVTREVNVDSSTIRMENYETESTSWRHETQYTTTLSSLR